MFRWCRLLLVLFFSIVCGLMHAQNVTIAVVDSATGEQLPGVVITKGTTAIGVTDVEGKCQVPADAVAPITLHYTGYFAKTVIVPPSDSVFLIRMISLTPELEGVTITSIRNNTGIDDNPTRVEVLGQEEMDEENGIKPGNITSLLGDLSCIQLQTQSAVSGETAVRIQGLDGRYTQLLRDGLPVYDGFSSGFGLLQLPPQDLKQIEVIKGPSSTLYGAGAIGGMINFVSRTPTDSAQYSATANITSLQEENLNFWTSNKPRQKFGYTFTASANHGRVLDVNNDGFSDVPAVNAVILHPRVFLYPNEKTSMIIGVEGAAEAREGGDMLYLDGHMDSLHIFHERNYNRRITGEFIFSKKISEQFSAKIAGCYTLNNRMLSGDAGALDGINQVGYAEVSGVYIRPKVDIVLGATMNIEDFEGRRANWSVVMGYRRNTLGAFAQLTWRPVQKLVFEMGMREDVVLRSWGRTDFFLPRVAALWKWNDRAGMRLSAGLGYKMPNPFTLVPEEHYSGMYYITHGIRLRAERSAGGEIDVYWRRRLGDHMAIYFNQSFFATEVMNPVLAGADSTYLLEFTNETKSFQTYGTDTYVRLSGEEMEVYIGYTWTHPQRLYDSLAPWIPNTPLHRISFTALYEPSETFRVGLEGSVIGYQYREDGTATPSYFIMAAMAAYTYHRFTFVLNGENLLNVLQSDYEPLYTGSTAAPVFKELWAPVDGRVINFSVRYKW